MQPRVNAFQMLQFDVSENCMMEREKPSAPTVHLLMRTVFSQYATVDDLLECLAFFGFDMQHVRQFLPKSFALLTFLEVSPFYLL